MKPEAIMDALAKILKDERQRNDGKLQEVQGDLQSNLKTISDNLQKIDGNVLIKSAAFAVADANLAALKNHAENVLLRKSKHLHGTLPNFAKGLQSGGGQ
ncbi:hypothetical protein SAMN05421759_102642 [Roseivivax lentus]|uniref:Uncharacterized protein n=1 Tax=Roseivivax lentus TaxID=633194 RepID=A0A1N7LEY6_9RHOB|nr:hypothetical protein [Roseivivax lentus]SIS72331.1 hypothetical protein SAMN05421759_102642 [Roseivivax lentus]